MGDQPGMELPPYLKTKKNEECKPIQEKIKVVNS